jgi:hypothetical protein
MTPDRLTPKQTRKAGLHIRVPVLPDEAELIQTRARRCGLSTAAYLRQLGLGAVVEDRSAAETLLALCRLHGELHRMAQLLASGSPEQQVLIVSGRMSLSLQVRESLAAFPRLQAELLTAVRRIERQA